MKIKLFPSRGRFRVSTSEIPDGFNRVATPRPSYRRIDPRPNIGTPRSSEDVSDNNQVTLTSSEQSPPLPSTSTPAEPLTPLLPAAPFSPEPVTSDLPSFPRSSEPISTVLPSTPHSPEPVKPVLPSFSHEPVASDFPSPDSIESISAVLPPIPHSLGPVKPVLPSFSHEPVASHVPSSPDSLEPISAVLPPIPHSLGPVKPVLPPIPHSLGPVQPVLPSTPHPAEPPTPPLPSTPSPAESFNFPEETLTFPKSEVSSPLSDSLSPLIDEPVPVIIEEQIPEQLAEEAEPTLDMGCVASDTQENEPAIENISTRQNEDTFPDNFETTNNKVNIEDKRKHSLESQEPIIEINSNSKEIFENEHHVEEKRDKRKSEEASSDIYNNGVDPIKEEESGEEAEDHLPEIPTDDVPNIKKVGVSGESPDHAPNEKKKGVSGESHMGKIRKAHEITIAKYEKDEANRKLIKQAFHHNQFLNFGLDSDELIGNIVDAMFIKTFPSGSYAIREGDPGSELYVIAKGSFDVFKGTEKVNTLGPGHVFGEIAVLYNSKRNASVMATVDSSVWALERTMFHRIMMKDGMQRTEENIKSLRSVPILKNLEKASLMKMADLLKKEYFQPFEDIIKQGDEGSTFYIIAAGAVKVTLVTPEGEKLEVGHLKPGDYFGERALINDEKRKATCTAMAKGAECLVLSRGPFMELLGSLEVLQQAAVQKKEEPRTTVGKQVSEFDYVKFDDLDFVGTLGVGGFGRVELVRLKKDRNVTFALKCLKKNHISEQQQRQHTFNEKNIMISCRSPFIARLYKTFRDPKFLYLLMEPCLGGDVWTLLQRHKVFDETISKFMTACVVEGLEYLHTRGIVYRDLKPENLMVDSKGYVKLVDFGFAKIIGQDSKTWTFAGTPEYLPPEIIKNKGHDRAADYWSLGIFIFEVMAGRPPFRGSDHFRTYTLIVKGIDYVRFPLSIPRPAENLIRKLCCSVPTQRIGYQKDGVLGIKNHKWFNQFDWDALAKQQLQPPLVPKVRGPDDLTNFERYPRDREVPPDDLSGWDADF